MVNYVSQYYRCPERLTQFNVQGTLSENAGYFNIENHTLCFGQISNGIPSHTPNKPLPAVLNQAFHKAGITYLPFDVSRVIDNLRLELYTKSSLSAGGPIQDSLPQKLYYLLRPLLPQRTRQTFQKIWLSDWRNITFPEWPLDCTVDRLMEQLLLMSMKAHQLENIPFIWFWPNTASGCAMITHDVETTVGRDFSETIMEITDSYQMKSCFFIVPEERYIVTARYLESIRTNGFEIGIHGLNHNGNLFADRIDFLKQVEQINAYGRQYGALGFRSPVLYRNQKWFDTLDFSYDMSVPNVGHLEPQRGGCCTIMPYFIGDILEFPLTTTQDYALFNYLKSHSIDLWEQQTHLILNRHGVATFLIHPDYITKPREQQVYRSLLTHLAELRDEKGLWISTPNEVNKWWRQRANMKLVEDGGKIRVEGNGSERATIAYAREKHGKLVYSFSSHE